MEEEVSEMMARFKFSEEESKKILTQSCSTVDMKGWNHGQLRNS